MLILIVSACFVIAGEEPPEPKAFDWKDYIVPALAVVTACKAITSVTPTNLDNKVLSFVLFVLNFLAGNFGKNKNKDA